MTGTPERWDLSPRADGVRTRLESVASEVQSAAARTGARVEAAHARAHSGAEAFKLRCSELAALTRRDSSIARLFQDLASDWRSEEQDWRAAFNGAHALVDENAVALAAAHRAGEARLARSQRLLKDAQKTRALALEMESAAAASQEGMESAHRECLHEIAAIRTLLEGLD